MIHLAAVEFNSAKVTLVHNHPSGNINPSDADLIIQRRIIESLKHTDIKVQNGIIINRTSGKYGIFGFEGQTISSSGLISEGKSKGKGKIPVKTYSFDTTEFIKDAVLSNNITSPSQVAVFLSQSRFGPGAKYQMLVLNSMNKVIARVNLSEPAEEDFRGNLTAQERVNSKFIDEVFYTANKLGGERIIIVSNTNVSARMVQDLMNGIKDKGKYFGIELIDYMTVEPSDVAKGTYANMRSAINDLVLGEKSAKPYGKKEVNNYITALAKKINKVFPDVKLNFVTSNELFDILKKTKEGADFQNASEVPLGMVYKGEVYINTDKARLDTPIHEFGHIWDNWAEKYHPELWRQGIKLVMKETALINWIKENNPELKGKWIYKEALAHVIGVNGANIVSQTRIGNKTLKEVFQIWLKKLWDSVRKAFGKDITNVAALNPETMTLKEFTEAIAKDLLGDNVISRNTVSNKKVSKQHEVYNESSVIQRLVTLAKELPKILTPGEGKQIADVFSQVVKDTVIKISENKNLKIVKGDRYYGVFHIIHDHYKTEEDWILAKELFMIPKLMRTVDPKYVQEGNKTKAVYEKWIGNIRYRVITEVDGNTELLKTFYTNRKSATGNNTPNTDFQKSSFNDNTNVSKSSEKSKISFQRINNKTKEFYSPLEKIIQATKQEKYTSKDFLNWLKNQKGYKPAEFEWIGLEDFLSDKRSVTKQELLDYIAANKVNQLRILKSMTSFYSNRKVKSVYNKESLTKRYNILSFQAQKSSFDDTIKDK